MATDTKSRQVLGKQCYLLRPACSSPTRQAAATRAAAHLCRRVDDAAWQVRGAAFPACLPDGLHLAVPAWQGMARAGRRFKQVNLMGSPASLPAAGLLGGGGHTGNMLEAHKQSYTTIRAFKTLRKEEHIRRWPGHATGTAGWGRMQGKCSGRTRAGAWRRQQRQAFCSPLTMSDRYLQPRDCCLLRQSPQLRCPRQQRQSSRRCAPQGPPSLIIQSPASCRPHAAAAHPLRPSR